MPASSSRCSPTFRDTSYDSGKQVEISAAFAAFGALLAGAAMLLSLLWNRAP